jgi:hypothetical protein
MYAKLVDNARKIINFARIVHTNKMAAIQALETAIIFGELST